MSSSPSSDGGGVSRVACPGRIRLLHDCSGRIRRVREGGQPQGQIPPGPEAVLPDDLKLRPRAGTGRYPPGLLRVKVSRRGFTGREIEQNFLLA